MIVNCVVYFAPPLIKCKFATCKACTFIKMLPFNTNYMLKPIKPNTNRLRNLFALAVFCSATFNKKQIKKTRKKEFMKERLPELARQMHRPAGHLRHPDDPGRSGGQL